MPDYFEYIDICKNHKIIQRTSNYGIPNLNGEIDSILISNPNNPTGVHNNLDSLIASTKSNQQMLIVDEAYIELVGESNSVAHLVKDNPHLVVLRTFSKFYGMTNNKVGYVIASPEIINLLNVPSPEEYAIELAKSKLNAINKKYVKEDIENRRTRLKNILLYIADEIIDSKTNFLMARNHEYPLKKIMDNLNVKVVDLDKNVGIENKGYIRIAVGSHKELDELNRRILTWKL